MMEKPARFKRLGVLLAVLLLLAAFTLPAFADTGPKPSLTIRFRDLPNTLCYAALLSKDRGTGPYTAWDGTEEDARFDPRPDAEGTAGEAIWRAFASYRDSDNFFFFQNIYTVSNTDALYWSYYPPQTFKVLLYIPKTDTLLCSDTQSRFAFDSIFDAALQTDAAGAPVALTMTQNQTRSADLLPFGVRVLLTVLVELLAALLFRLRSKQQLLLLTGVNLATQVLLNLLLQTVVRAGGRSTFLLALIVCEVLVFVLEALIDCFTLPKWSKREHRRVYYAVYALAANAASLAAGLALTVILPQLF